MEPMLIARENIGIVLPHIIDEIKYVIEMNPHPDCYLPKVLTDLTSAHRQLWLLGEKDTGLLGWMITKIEAVPTGLRFLVLDLMHGKQLETLLEHLPYLEKWSAQYGVTEVRALVRPGLRKHLKKHGFRHTCDLVSKPIEGQLH